MIYVCELGIWSEERKQKLAAAARRAGLADGEAAVWQGNARIVQHRREHLTAWLLLLHALRREAGIAELAQLQLTRNAHGKPISTAHPELFFNLSHCQKACACVLSDRPVGIDVERKLPYKEALMRRICTTGEREIFDACQNEAERAGLLSVLWPMKESCVKQDGRGISGGLDQVCCAPYLLQAARARNGRSAAASLNGKMPEAGDWQAIATPAAGQSHSARIAAILQMREMQLYTAEEYALAVCGCADPGPVWVPEEELMQR